MTDLTADFVRGLLDYSPSTGEFRWLVSRSRIRAGSLAGRRNRDGYIVVKISYRMILAHRLAWLYTRGVWPESGLDHINGVRDDNRIANLREASDNENQQNRRTANKNSKSGFLGVNRRRERWQAVIKIDGRQRYIGLFDTPEEAHAAYLKAKAELHPFQTICEAA